MDMQAMKMAAAVCVFWTSFFAAAAAMCSAMGVMGVPIEAQDAEFWMTFGVSVGFVSAAWFAFIWAFAGWIFGGAE